MRKSGKIINIEKNKVYIITANNEFVTLEKHEAEPTIGELYAGEVFQNTAIWKYILTNCLHNITFIFIKETVFR